MDGFPYYLRFLTKFVFDILPAALASVIGGFLFTQYHATRAPEPKLEVIERAAPAQMQEAMRMVRDEHNLIVDFLKAQQAATEKSRASFDQARAKAAAESREAAARETAMREAVLREAADKLAAIKRRDLEQAKLAEQARLKPAVDVAAIEPVRAPMPIAPAANASAPNATASNDLRPPADIPNEPRRTGPIDATIGFARDVTGRAVSTVLEIPGWIGDRILGGAPSVPAPSGRLTSAQY
jgi:hypothetical protein